MRTPIRLFATMAAAVATSTYIARSGAQDRTRTHARRTAPLEAIETPSPSSTAVPTASAASSPAAHVGARSLLSIAIAAAGDWSRRRAASKGAALALYTLLSMAPMLILVLSFVALFVDRDTAQRLIVDQLGALVGDQGGTVVKGMLSARNEETKGFFAGLVSLALVLLGATTAFGELKESLDELWEVKAKSGSGVWNVVRERFLSLGLLLVLGLMLLSSLVVSAGLAAASGVFGDSMGTVFAKVAAELVALVVLMLLFSVIFKFLPAVKLAWRDVIVGAAVTSVLFLIGKTAIGLYLGHGGVSDVFGAAGSLVALIVWMYYSAQIFFYGALFTHEFATTVGSRKDASRSQARSDRR